MTRTTKKPKKKNLLIGLLILILLGVGLFLFLTSDFFSINYIRVENNDFFSESDIIEKSKVKLGTNIFKVDLDDIHDNMVEDPYIKSSTIRRKLPDKLIINVVERKESACIAFMDKWVVLDEEGYILRITDSMPECSVLEDFTVTDFTLGKQIQVNEMEKLISALKVIQQMNKNNLFFKNVGIEDKEMVLYISDKLKCKGEVELLTENMDALRDILYDLYKRGIKRGTISIRGNGYYSYSPLEE